MSEEAKCPVTDTDAVVARGACERIGRVRRNRPQSDSLFSLSLADDSCTVSDLCR